MMWIVLLRAWFRHKRVFVEQVERPYLWSGVVNWVTPWVVSLRVSYDEPSTDHIVWIPMKMVEGVRDFSPNAARAHLEDSWEEPPSIDGVPFR